MCEKILRLIEIFSKHYDFHNNKFKDLSEDIENEFEELWKDIKEDLIWSPGTLIYFEDSIELEKAKAMIDLIYKTFDSEQIFDEILTWTSLGVNIIGNYADRIEMLKPTFISINPQNFTSLKIYFEEAMKAWLFGLNNSSLILCCSILEDIVKEELYKIDKELVFDLDKNENGFIIGVKNFPFEKLINKAYDKGLITLNEKIKAHEIRELRNDAIHGLQSISDEQAYDVIMDTKNIIENLLK